MTSRLLNLFSLALVLNGACSALTAQEGSALLKGQTVYVAISPQQAVVTAECEVLVDAADDQREAAFYLPVYASSESTSSQVLRDSNIVVQAGSGREYKLVGTTPPEHLEPIETTAPVHWFVLLMDDVEPGVPGQSFKLHISYRQRLVNGQFLYLPLTHHRGSHSLEGRSWSHQLLARRGDKVVRLGNEVEGATLGDTLVVYLKQLEEVSIK
ncbi:MAG: hypothetical protein SFV32_04845 [Opitutaceae bacterium]|nr:hypothetical protein [Opitutaceae bacterium]